MKYGAGKIADLLGVSIETVRNYEKLGLISPARNDQNSYREYDAIDLNILRRVRTYSSCGLSVKQSADLILHGTVEDLAVSFGEMGASLSEKIRYDMQLLIFLKQKQAHLSRISAMQSTSCIENSPPMYGLQFREDLKFIMDAQVESIFRDWSEMRPFAESMLKFSKDNFIEDGLHYFHGLCIEEQYADFYGIAENEHIAYYPARKCLYSFVKNVFETKASAENSSLKVAKKDLERMGLTMVDDPFGRVLHTSKADGEYHHYIEVWIPIA
ncbi:MerR family transcriptional regulator [Christensenellaceae bacterium OttesenSCG-928-M15]|nr:MerR family transcriptional regulator [Christensenellaceae bacterium OttesenSCG-928-M15]